MPSDNLVVAEWEWDCALRSFEAFIQNTAMNFEVHLKMLRLRQVGCCDTWHYIQGGHTPQCPNIQLPLYTFLCSTGISSEIRTKLRDWVVWQARAGCYSQATSFSSDPKTLYMRGEKV